MGSMHRIVPARPLNADSLCGGRSSTSWRGSRSCFASRRRRCGYGATIAQIVDVFRSGGYRQIASGGRCIYLESGATSYPDGTKWTVYSPAYVSIITSMGGVPVTQWRVLGFEQALGMSVNGVPRQTFSRLIVPDWSLVLLFALLPVTSAAQVRPGLLFRLRIRPSRHARSLPGVRRCAEGRGGSRLIPARLGAPAGR